MKRTILAVLLAVAVLVGAGPGAALAGGAVGQTDGTETDQNGTETGAIAPGEQFSGSVSVAEAEIEGDLDVRAFDRRVAEAADDDARAAVVADAVNGTTERLAELRERRDELRERRENGTISESEYRVRTARLAAEISTAERVANRSASVAEGIPNETLAANGVDAERIETLRSEARDLRGGEVAEIARGIAGGNAGGSPGSPPADRGPAGTPGQSDAVGGEDDRPSDDARNGSTTSDGDGTANGAADTGTADGSGDSTDDGSTDEGSADDGSTNDGSTDDGSTDENTATPDAETADDDGDADSA